MSPSSALATGDRVVITNPDHPHHGEVGELGPTATFLFPWQVALDVGGSCCVDEQDVLRVGGRS